MTPYSNVREEIPDDCPTLLGNPVITTTWVDANLYHDFMDKTPIVLVSSLIPTLPFELLQVSSYRRYPVFQLSYSLKC